MMKKRRLSKKEIKDIRSRYRNGELVKEISKNLSISVPSVYYHLQDIKKSVDRQKALPLVMKGDFKSFKKDIFRPNYQTFSYMPILVMLNVMTLLSILWIISHGY